MNGYQRCPRCGEYMMECLSTHAHCWECNYILEDHADLKEWARLEFRRPRSSNRNFKNNRELEQLLGIRGGL